MSPPGGTVRCVIDIEVGSEPVRGLVSVAGSPRVPFLGWLELVSTLDRSRRPAGPDPEDPETTPSTEE